MDGTHTVARDAAVFLRDSDVPHAEHVFAGNGVFAKGFVDYREVCCTLNDLLEGFSPGGREGAKNLPRDRLGGR